MSDTLTQSTRTVELVSIASIKKAPFNPTNRTEPRKLARLRASIERIGLVYPIALNNQNQLIDGHRRLAAAEGLGWTEIPAVRVSGNRAEIYGEVNDNSRRLTGKDLLSIFFQNPDAVGPASRRAIELAIERVGRAKVRQIHRAGGTVAYVRWAEEVASFCGKSDSKRFVGQAITWILKHRQARLVKAVMTAGSLTAEQLTTLIRHNRSIRTKLEV